MQTKKRVLIARLGMDAHWRGSVVVARAIRDAGFEVIYLGNQSPESIVEIAIEEDVDLIGLSTLSGNHLVLIPEIIKYLKIKKIEDKPIMLGGTIPPDDVPLLKKAGVTAIFGPGSSLAKIVEFVDKL